ncbi:hypothetical protein HJC23_004482 [Cyclotella cryptica]|uniref:G-protein coupled receptors family 1 profile domain-containing protein n=1 Tax=Cyclotella cryptica TaxID=29204 RepID=A0ABD3PSU8_9STRA|eukprot:CCRYP_011933-RA/>CCRYP_011933-RA protein AED:0.03 eAED:0.03 QI:391/1/1/1/1/1/2/295/334
MVYSESEQKILAIFPHITGGLSLIGSSSIVYDIWKDRDYKMKQPYYRILLGMSMFDVVCSMSLCLSTIPIPAGTEGVFGARGTTGTCTASGFFNQLMLGSMLYNGVLAIYYTLSGTYRMADEDFARKYEPWCHGLVVFVTIGVALAGLPLTLYNNSQLWCWIAPYPVGCESFSGQHSPDLPCERGNDAWLYRWLFYYGPLWTTIGIVTVLMIVLTLSIMKEEKDIIMLRNRSIQARRNSLEAEEGTSNENSDNSRPRLPKSESFRLERTKKMFYQALLYVGVFYITWIIPTINRVEQMVNDGNSPFGLAVGTAILAPMQGIWNWLVYRHGPCVA